MFQTKKNKQKNYEKAKKTIQKIKTILRTRHSSTHFQLHPETVQSTITFTNICSVFTSVIRFHYASTAHAITLNTRTVYLSESFMCDGHFCGCCRKSKQIFDFVFVQIEILPLSRSLSMFQPLAIVNRWSVGRLYEYFGDSFVHPHTCT